MPGKWPTQTLREAGVTLLDCVHKTPAEDATGECRYVAIPQMVNGHVDLDSARRISGFDFEEWTKKAKPQAHDVVLSRRCNPGETVYVAPGEKFALGQNLVLLRADGKTVFPPFLRWLVRGPAWWEQIRKNLNVGAVFDSLKCRDVPLFKVPVPPLADQRAIASVLGALDDKIEQNRRTAQALEQLAQAIFRAWFVDFEPVKAKAAGATSFPSMPQPVFDALPTTFIDSDIGPVPEGWEVLRLDELLILQRGFDLPKKSRAEGTRPVFAASGFNGVHSQTKVKGPGVVTGRSGVLGRVFFVDSDFWPLNTTLWVKEYKRSNPWHAYFLLQTLDLAHFNSGSAVPTLNRNHVHSLPIVSAPRAVLEVFEQTCKPIFCLRGHIHGEDDKLAQLRDYLLPKLLSGQVRVRDAERAVATVA